MGKESEPAPSLLAETRRLLRQYGLYARRSLGQNFLVNLHVLSKVLAAAELSPSDLVLEVGPGLGALTRELVTRAAKVIAVEVDVALVELLKRELASHANLVLVQQDILQVDLPSLLRGTTIEERPGIPPYKVVANLPYHLTSPVLRLFLEQGPRPTKLVVMVQREVGQRILAQPNQMNPLAISVQFYGRPRLVARLSPGSFVPPPKVSSVVVCIDVCPEPTVAVSNAGTFFEMVRAGFRTPRKQLHNALSEGLWLASEDTRAILKQARIDPTRRAQTLSLDEWARVAEASVSFHSQPLPPGSTP